MPHMPAPAGIPPAEWAALRDQQEFEKNEFMRIVAAKKLEFNARVAAKEESLSRQIEADKAKFNQRVAAERDALSKRHMQQDTDLFNNRAQTAGGRRAATAVPANCTPPGVARATATPTKTQQTQKTHSTPARASQTPQMTPAATKPRSRPSQAQRKVATEVIDLCSDEEDQPPVQKRSALTQKPVVEKFVAPRNPTAPSKPFAQQPVLQTPSFASPHHENEDEDCIIVESDSSSSEPTQNLSSNSTIPTATFSLFASCSAPKNLAVHSHVTIPKDQHSREMQLFPDFKREPSSTPSMSSHTRAPSASPMEQQFNNGLPSFGSGMATSSSRASTVAPQFGGQTVSPLSSNSSQAKWTTTNLITPSSQRTATPPGTNNAATPPSKPPTFMLPPFNIQPRVADKSPAKPAFMLPPFNIQPRMADKSPTLPFNSLRQQTQDRSSILREPTPLPKNPALFNLEQQKQNGSFVNNVLRNERSQCLAPELGNVLAGKADDVEMEDVTSRFTPVRQHVPTRPATPALPAVHDVDVMDLTGDAPREQPSDAINVTTPKSCKQPRPTPCPSGEDDPENRQVTTSSIRQQRATTPPPSHASIKSKTPKVFTPSSNVPSTPASATPGGRNVRAGTVESQASSYTSPAARTQRGESIASRPSNTSSRTSTQQKRKRPFEANLSSGGESDWAPSEPDSPGANKLSRKDKETPASKKSKAADGSASKPKATYGTKNGFGFKTITATQPSTAAQSKKSAPSTPVKSSKPIADSKPKSTFKSKSARQTSPIMQPSKRRAAMQAENKINVILEVEKGFKTESVIEEADRIEEPARLTGHMRQLSITPAPSESQLRSESLGTSRDTNAGSYMDTDDEDARPIARPSRTRTTASASDAWKAHCDKRARGDRHIARHQPMVEDDDLEADINYDIKSDRSWKARR